MAGCIGEKTIEIANVNELVLVLVHSMENSKLCTIEGNENGETGCFIRPRMKFYFSSAA